MTRPGNVLAFVGLILGLAGVLLALSCAAAPRPAPGLPITIRCADATLGGFAVAIGPRHALASAHLALCSDATATIVGHSATIERTGLGDVIRLSLDMLDEVLPAPYARATWCALPGDSGTPLYTADGRLAGLWSGAGRVASCDAWRGLLDVSQTPPPDMRAPPGEWP